jgi:Fuc2NAc and GlcNAc transferase
VSAEAAVVIVWVCSALIGLWLTGVVYRYAVAHAILDIPNVRSSHSAPTPRGGGIAIALIGCGAGLAAVALGWLRPTEAAGLVGGGALVAMVGWLDDRRPRSPAFRALAQFIAAIWLLGCAGQVPAMTGGVFAIARLVGLTLVVVWSVNLFNFMDGIDGIAGGLGLVAATGGTALLLDAGLPGLALCSAAIAGSCAGFLRWNWSPAKIFMGDAGSNVLGFWFGGIAVLSQGSGGPDIGVWMLLGGCFVADATITLLRRLARGERWYEAHRTHAYQRAVTAGFTHAQVSATTMGLTLLLFALGMMVWRGRVPLSIGAGIGGGVLLAAYLWVERLQPMPPRSTPT